MARREPPRRAAPASRAPLRHANLPNQFLVLLRQRTQRVELRREKGLVDLALVDRYAFLDADADDLLAVDPELLRELFGREVVGHALSPCPAKKPAGASRRAG